MNAKEYLSNMMHQSIDEVKTTILEKQYHMQFPEIIKHMISCNNEPIFFDDKRVLSFGEMKNAEEELHVAFSKRGIFPVIDCGENDFIVYYFSKNNWMMFNIVDEVSFKQCEKLEELL